MTKRRLSNKKPSGANRSLGNTLLNEREKLRVKCRQNNKIDDENFESAAYLDLNKKTPKNIDSVTDETNLDEFLAKATLAGTEFTAERLIDFRLIENATNCFIPTKRDISSNLELQKKYSHRLLIPRRPNKRLWETPEQLIALETENFLEWRKGLAELQEVDGLVLTPFERNLELWRQLWRVIERSDIVVQVVDARNPLLFRNADLELYVKECDVAKHNIILINKADLLTDRQIDLWRGWFIQNNIDIIFWCALEEQKQQSKLESLKEYAETSEVQGKDHGDQEGMSSESESDDAGSDGGIQERGQIIEEEENPAIKAVLKGDNMEFSRAPFIQSPETLIAYLKWVGRAASIDIANNRPLVVGMVGYPNVGKSSTINRILGIKKVSTSSTPGKTRHLQTVFVDDQMILCDCPGLVMPSFALNRSEMLLNGILSVDHMRDHFAPISLLVSRIPRQYLERHYSIMLPKPADHEAPNRPPTAHELLTSVAFIRGFMAASGIPDCSRAARLILKDAVNGRLKWVASPPNMEQWCFDQLTYPVKSVEETGILNKERLASSSKGVVLLQQLEKRHLIEGTSTMDKSFDRQFFSFSQGAAHIRTARQGVHSNSDGRGDKKHHNKGKKEKLRRVFMDQ